MSDRLFLSAAICALFCSVVAMDMTVKSDEGWQLLKEFEFEEGLQVEFEYNVTFPTSYVPTKLLFYKREQYLSATSSIDGNPKTCEARQSVLQESTAVWYQTQTLQQSNVNCTPVYDGVMGEALWCRGRVAFPGQEERIWFVVVSRCGNINSIPGVDFRYSVDKVMMTTTPPPTFPTIAFYPSGQSTVTCSTFTLASLLVLKQLFA